MRTLILFFCTSNSGRGILHQVWKPKEAHLHKGSFLLLKESLKNTFFLAVGYCLVPGAVTFNNNIVHNRNILPFWLIPGPQGSFEWTRTGVYLRSASQFDRATIILRQKAVRGLCTRQETCYSKQFENYLCLADAHKPQRKLSNGEFLSHQGLSSCKTGLHD